VSFQDINEEAQEQVSFEAGRVFPGYEMIDNYQRAPREMKFTHELPSRQIQGVPEGMIIKTETHFRHQPSPFEREEAFIMNAVEKRKSEYRTGRHTAREALNELNIPPCAIPSGVEREPLWPKGVVGSISHCSKLCVAAVGPDSRFLSIGVDVEPNKPLPPDVQPIVVNDEDHWKYSQPKHSKDFDVLTFSAKESIFKCIFPIFRLYLDFKDVSLTIDQSNNSFNAKLPERISNEVKINPIHGIYSINTKFVFTLAYIFLKA